MKAALLLLVPALAFAAPEEDPVRSVLFARDGRTLDAAAWRRLGDDVEQRLAMFALDTKLISGARARALAGLGELAGPVALITLRSVLASPASPELAAAALGAYARAAPTSDRADVVARARPLLGHADPLQRRAAARALAITKSPDAVADLRARLAREPSADVKRELRVALDGIERDQKTK